MRVVVVGGSDAGIEATRRCLELNRSVQVNLLVGDAYPNFSICGIPYYRSGDVPDWRHLPHRTLTDGAPRRWERRRPALPKQDGPMIKCVGGAGRVIAPPVRGCER